MGFFGGIPDWNGNGRPDAQDIYMSSYLSEKENSDEEKSSDKDEDKFDRNR